MRMAQGYHPLAGSGGVWDLVTTRTQQHPCKMPVPVPAWVLVRDTVLPVAECPTMLDSVMVWRHLLRT